MSGNWTGEDWAAYKRAGMPEGWEPPRKALDAKFVDSMEEGMFDAPAAKPPRKDPVHIEKNLGKRTEKRAGGRIPRTIVDATAEVGCKFDSKAEARFYDHLASRAYVGHVDVHPIFTLPGGIRYKADFVSWPADDDGEAPWPSYAPRVPTVWDVKGMKPSTAFNRVRRLFDAHHPLAPLRVVRWRKGKWEEIEK